MKKRLAAVLLASLLAVSPAAAWAADSGTNEMIMAAESFAEEVLTSSEEKTIDELIEQVLPEGMTKEEAAEYLRLAAEVLTSEEFQALLAHVEVQELLEEVIRRGAVLVKEEPEMVKEILRTLGVKEGVIEVLSLAYDHMDVIIPLAEEYLESEEGKQLISALGEMKDNMDYQELMQGLLLLMDTDASSVPESVAESPEGEAGTEAGQE